MPPGYQKAEEIFGFSEKNVRNRYVCSSGWPEGLSKGEGSRGKGICLGSRGQELMA